MQPTKTIQRQKGKAEVRVAVCPGHVLGGLPSESIIICGTAMLYGYPSTPNQAWSKR